MQTKPFEYYYGLTKAFYGDRVAERSQVPLMNHIDEGLIVLKAIDASLEACKAYVIHPLFQNNPELLIYSESTPNMDPLVVMLVMEYRNQANAWLSPNVNADLTLRGYPRCGPLDEVRAMLTADKVQNYKDFRLYHADTHPRAAELQVYFETWFKALHLLSSDVHRFIKMIMSEQGLEFPRKKFKWFRSF